MVYRIDEHLFEKTQKQKDSEVIEQLISIKTILNTTLSKKDIEALNYVCNILEERING